LPLTATSDCAPFSMISVAASVFPSRLGKRFWANSAVWSWLSPAVGAFQHPSI
jgi:hypothetical protein